MKRFAMSLILIMGLTGLVFADEKELQEDPISKNVILQLDAGQGLNTNDIQKMFTALGTSYLKNNSSYILAYEVYRERNRQDLRSSLVLTELHYEAFSIINLRYTFSNGYFEFKFSESPFTAIVNDEVVYSIDYSSVGRPIYNSINRKLQDAAYISRGHAAGHRKSSSVSFYLFK
ncbi:hypothetical protein LQZ19_03195 [Treponema primitia]|uniref:hypothetical protein n=1 Tax=Treponema primitia TaxID=88058 RepID=UPI00398051C5